MALINPEGLYGKGSTFDPLPYLRLAAEEKNKKQAREEAITKYYEKLPETLNDKGLRDQEVEQLNVIKNQLYDYNAKNADAIKNGNPQAKRVVEGMMRKGNTIIREGLNAAKNDVYGGKIALNKDNQYFLNSDTFLNDHKVSQLPVNHPDYKPIDYNKFLADRPFDNTKFSKEANESIKYKYDVPAVTPHPTDPYLEVVTPVRKFDDISKDEAYKFGVRKFYGDPIFHKEITTKLAGTSQLKDLNILFEKTYGRPIKGDEDIAVAYTLSNLKSPDDKPIIRPNTKAIADAKNLQAEKMQEDRQKHAKEMQRQSQSFQSSYKGATTDQKIKLVGDYIQSIKDNSNPKFTGLSKSVAIAKGEPAPDENLYILNLSPTDLSGFKQSYSETTQDNNGKNITNSSSYTPTEVLHNRKTNQYVLVGPAKNGKDMTISEDQFTAGIVKGTAGTTALQNQLNTNKTFSTKKTTTNTGKVKIVKVPEL